MKNVKSERLKKLEGELNDLEQWLKLGLVPKKDIEKHKEEITSTRHKIDEEKDRLRFLRESGEAEEYVTPKKIPGKPGYTEMPTLPDVDFGEATGGSESGFDMDTETTDIEASNAGEDREEKEEGEEEAATEDDTESPFSDRNRWRRGGIIDPDANEW